MFIIVEHTVDDFFIFLSQLNTLDELLSELNIHSTICYHS